jgi:hypothetical protein
MQINIAYRYSFLAYHVISQCTKKVSGRHSVFTYTYPKPTATTFVPDSTTSAWTLLMNWPGSVFCPSVTNTMTPFLCPSTWWWIEKHLSSASSYCAWKHLSTNETPLTWRASRTPQPMQVSPWPLVGILCSSCLRDLASTTVSSLSSSSYVL